MRLAAVMRRAVGSARIVVGVAVLGILGYAYWLVAVAGDPSPFDYFGYFTNLTGLLTCVLLIGSGIVLVMGGVALRWLTLVRGVAVACMIIVGVVYNTLVPGTGSAPPWVSAVLHVVFPLLVLLDWVFPDGARPPDWRDLWVVLPYPLLWLTVVLIRGVTDGWVPYGFLLPERGLVSLMLHVVGLLAALLVAGAIVWATARLPARTRIPRLGAT